MKNYFISLHLFLVYICSYFVSSTSSFIRREQLEVFGLEVTTGEPVNQSVLDVLFNWNVNLNHYDFYGNELPLPDRTLPNDHYFCIRLFNDSELFRRFAGLLMAEEGSEALVSMDSFSEWTFYRINQLKTRYYGEADLEDDFKQISFKTGDEIMMDRLRTKVSFAFWNTERDVNEGPELDMANYLKNQAYKLKKTFPVLYSRFLSEDQLSLFELLIADLLYLILPILRGSSLDAADDLSGIMMLLFLLKVDDLTGYSHELIDFYTLMQRFSGDNIGFNLPSLQNKSIINFDRQVLLEELFRLSVEMNFAFTFELFIQLDLVDIESLELMEFVLEKAACPVILNRMMDIVTWTDGTRLHFVYEKYPLLLSMVFENNLSWVDWDVGEFGVERGGRTFLGRLLTSVSPSAFEEEPENRNGPFSCAVRNLLKELLTKVGKEKKLLLTGRKPDRDIMDEWMESEGMGMVFEYFSYVELDCDTLNNFIERIVEVWRRKGGEEQVVLHSKLFKYLVKKCDRKCSKEILPVIKEAYELLRGSERPSITRMSSSGSGRGSSNDLRALSAEFFSQFLPLFDSKRSGTPSPVPPVGTSPRKKANLDLLKFLVQEAERLYGNDEDKKEMIQAWKQDLDQGF